MKTKGYVCDLCSLIVENQNCIQHLFDTHRDQIDADMILWAREYAGPVAREWYYRPWVTDSYADEALAAHGLPPRRMPGGTGGT